MPKIPTSRKKNDENLISLFKIFIRETKSGKRHQKNGIRLRKSSINNYEVTYQSLCLYEAKYQLRLRIRDIRKLTKRELDSEKVYWKRFYRDFSDFLYQTIGAYDNYAGFHFKNIRTFFNYLINEKGMPIGNFHKQFYIRKETIPILVLSSERLQFLINNRDFESSLSPILKKVKDIFVIGCTVGLRVSDLFQLRKVNLEKEGIKQYLCVRSKKTNTLTKVLLPDYAIEIFQRNEHQNDRLLPQMTNAHLNRQLKILMQAAGWTEPKLITRQQQGTTIILYKNTKAKAPYRFCDLVTSHTMRRTAITTMLTLGMSEHLVRKISGHAPGSREFFRYVEISQNQLDNETQKVFFQLKNDNPQSVVCA